MASLGSVGTLLITGASGFTGRHLAEAFSRDGWRIAGLGPDRGPQEADHLDTDLNDTEVLTKWISHVNPTHVVHLAALSNVVGDPLSFYRVNVLGTESLLEALKSAGARLTKLIVASSANIYGNARSSPVSERASPRPMNHYALSKLAMEFLVEKWFDRFPIIVTRPFNYTGPGQSEDFVFAKIVSTFRRRDHELRLGNVDVARDISDIRFVVEAYRRLLHCGAASDVFNICSGRSVSLMAAVDELAQFAGYRPRIVVDPKFVRKDDIRELYGDPSKLFSTVGQIPVPPLGTTLEFMYRSSR